MRPRLWRDAIRSTGALRDQPRNRPVRTLVELGSRVARHGPNLYALTAWSAARFPSRVALVDDHGSLTYTELIRAADMAVGWLHDRSATMSTDRIALLSNNGREMVCSLLAAQRLGIDVLILNPMMSADQIADVAQRHRVAMILADHDAPGYSVIPHDEGEAAPPRHRLWLPPRRGAIVLLTSGTTGSPKIVDRDASAISIDLAASLLVRLGIRVGDRVSMMLPLSHGHGLASLALSLSLGGTTTLRKRPDISAEHRSLRNGEVDVIVLVPTLLRRLLDEPGERLVAPRVIVSGSAPLAADLVRRTHDLFGPVLHNVYGTSELGALTHASPAMLTCEPTSVGTPLAGVELCIENSAQGSGRRSVIKVKGGMAGTSWVATGDLGSWSPSGTLIVHGRADDVLVCGGENVTPDELEARFLAWPEVTDCAVAGQPDDEYGTAIELFVVLSPSTTEDQLRAQIQRRLPRTLRPKWLSVVATIPRTPNGKIRRRALTRERCHRPH